MLKKTSKPETQLPTTEFTHTDLLCQQHGLPASIEPWKMHENACLLVCEAVGLANLALKTTS